MSISQQKLQELLARARAQASEADKATAKELADHVATSVPGGADFTAAGISDDAIQTDAGADAAVEVLKDVISNLSSAGSASESQSEVGPEPSHKEAGVARRVTLNEKQELAVSKVVNGESIVLIGAAGTGKTTSVRQMTERLLENNSLPKLSISTKWLLQGKPGVAILSYTRKAVNNIRHAVVEQLRPHVITIHKLLEYQPVYYQIEDPDNAGQFKNTMRFEPTRNSDNPLPAQLALLIHEESSMEAVDLYHLVCAAMPHKYQEVFLGDIQQLPPVFGLAILGFKMNELPVVELTHVYRQALNSPIIDLAWKLLEGNPHEFSPLTEKATVYSERSGKDVTRIFCPTLDKLTRVGYDPEDGSFLGEVRIQVWQKRLSPDTALFTSVVQFNQWADQGYYNPQEDIILCPFNKAFGTIELNKGIAQHLGVKREAQVHEVIAGFNKHYLAVGDRVLFDKEDAFITAIYPNGEYLGVSYQQPSVHLDRWGHLQQQRTEQEILQQQATAADFELQMVENFLDRPLGGDDSRKERVQSASHIIHIQLTYGEEDKEEVLKDAASINDLLGGYALTVHKFQGSENDRVFLFLHQSHAVMVSRELLYTAVTRAKKFLHIVCETDTFYKGVQSQRIKGDTLLEKAEFFKGKQSDYEEKKAAIVHNPDAVAQPAEYRGAKPATALPEIQKQEEKVSVPLIKLSELVTGFIKQKAAESLATAWLRATMIWGKDKIGEAPILSFNLTRQTALGLANLRTGVVKLNALWCAVAETDEDVRHEMLHTTLIHELCHIIAYRTTKERGHGTGWKMAMQLMGLPAERVYDNEDGTLPPWTEAMQQVVAEAKEKLAQKNYDVNEYIPLEDGEQV